MTIYVPNLSRSSSEAEYDFSHVPAEIKDLRRWLVWKFQQKSGEPKPRKIPLYVDGGWRGSGLALDTREDVDRLESFDRAYENLLSSERALAGIGFAVVTGDQVGGIDLDNCLDETGVLINEIALKVVKQAVSDRNYVEKSPSGRGLRIIGSTTGFQNFNRSGYEAYCSKRFLTITGRCIHNPDSFGSIDNALALMNQMVPNRKLGSQSRVMSARVGRVDLSTGGYLEPNHVGEGGRNHAVLSHVGHLRKLGFQEDKILKLALEFNNKVCNPPLEEAEIEDIVSRYANQTMDQEPADSIGEVNAGHAWIESAASIYRLEYRDFISPADLRIHFANRMITVQTGDHLKLVDLGSLWLKSPLRRQHRELVMQPSEPPITKDNCLNVWSGFAVKPTSGGVDPFIELLTRLVPQHEAALYVLNWIAHLIQRPGAKMFTSLVFWSQQQGVGKNLLFECLSEIIGSRHSTIIGQSELSRDFNGWAADKILIIGDEVSSADRRQHEDKLKTYITGSTVQLNEKHQQVRVVENLLNFIFLSNHCNAMFISDHDRRYFVWEIAAGPLSHTDVQKFVQWRNNGGLGNLLCFLQSIKLGTFNPRAPAPQTDAKLQMVDDNRSDLEAWASSIMSSGASMVLGREIATSFELAERYGFESNRERPSSKTIIAAFKRLGGRGRPSQVRLPSGKRVRVIALERTSYWEQQASEAECAAEIVKPLNSASMKSLP